MCISVSSNLSEKLPYQASHQLPIIGAVASHQLHQWWEAHHNSGNDVLNSIKSAPWVPVVTVRMFCSSTWTCAGKKAFIQTTFFPLVLKLHQLQHPSTQQHHPVCLLYIFSISENLLLFKCAASFSPYIPFFPFGFYLFALFGKQTANFSICGFPLV